MAILSAKNIGKTYAKRAVVNDVSLHVASNEIVGLLGPNGAGKTTSFYMLVGLVRADAGHIFYDEQEITHYPMHIRAKLGVGYLPQEASVFRKLSVSDNLRAVLELRKGLSKGQIDLIIDELLDEFSISHIRNNIGMGLSGGERRRVEIARALATDPEFILLDEPFAGVDPISVIEIQKIIAHLKERDIGVLITEHNVRETLGICDRAYILNAGQVIAEGSSAEIVANEEVRRVYLGENFSL
ncbi:lipopolysaccharide export system ATP-binding protein [Bathymodiolus platifrons methanotrophic gill symbiont]|uniref:LPS export ABC transporter ATP-binding protein n=1 Tax=Bathymodiolus platifrons methanotrophic gill symbiont TaxID=113268 RepID=UPI000B409B52|nr:LPS export ABC transporter ATP-binding protein [Bathymodiolus platifrons methanotrophic gill symbiont]MCK5869692.1 LPS export ABC transporter ATP-binding protein [Methyloprofundus sp.]TXK96139.1 LPS export ABC transporter ATP-binding protein [Methylococcaceae bacterium CS4]TXK97778.1 LPS export ABC transporter ATP-binding protein [Methylococcaceae bacterium CS5]TXL05782.1 LPS export ABC transporter ATP-binding protein [Methylococcaceae bacterium CS1]TXL08132.1 LPS export ABC transporter ATP